MLKQCDKRWTSLSRMGATYSGEMGDNVLRDFSLSYFRTLVAVAETGSFRRAAERLDVGHPVGSRRVQKLENVVGVSLFERSSSGTTLTIAGQDFVFRCRKILQQVNVACENARLAGSGATGRLRIGLIGTLSGGVLREILEDFAARHPFVDLVFSEGERSDLFTQLSHRQIDIMVAPGFPDRVAGDALLLAWEAIFVAVSANHTWADRERLDWSELRDTNLIVGGDESASEIRDYVLRGSNTLANGVRIRRHRVGNEGVMMLVGLGMGVSLITEHRLSIVYPNVTFVPISQTKRRVPFSLMWRPENDNPALRRFISLARIEAKKNGAVS